MSAWYQTRYCLTQGIKEIRGSYRYSAGDQYVSHGNHGFDRIDKDIFATIEEARVDQSQRARKEIAAAEKKIAKLKGLL